MDFKIDSPLFDSSSVIRDQADFKRSLLDAQNFLNIQKMTSFSMPSGVGSPSMSKDDELLMPIVQSMSGLPDSFSFTPVSDYEINRYNDPRLGFIPGLDPVLQEDRYSRNQSNLSIAAHFIPKLGFEVVNKLGSGIGAMSGFATDTIGLTTGAKYDNAIINLFENLSDFNKDYFRTYASAKYAGGSILGQMGTAKFWDDDALDGLAFLTSALVPGLAFTKLGKLVSLTRLGTAAGATAEATTAFGELSGVSQSIGKTLMGATNVIAKGINSSRKLAAFKPFEVTKIGNGLLNGSITTYNTITEAAIEGRDTYKKVLADGLEAGLDTEVAKKNALDAADNTFWWNTAALILPNYIQTKAFFGKTGLFNGVFDDIKSVRKAVATGALKAEDVTFMKEIGKNIGLSILSEGAWEENIQQVIQNTESDKDRGTLGGFNLDTIGKFVDEMVNGLSYFGRGITGEVLPTEEQEHAKAILLGGLIGIVGGVTGGVKSTAQKKGMIEVAKLESNIASVMDSHFINAFTDDMRVPFKQFEITNPDGTKKKTFLNPQTNQMEMDFDKASKIVFSRLYQTSLFTSYLNKAIDGDPVAMTMLQDQALGLLAFQFLNKKFGSTNENFYDNDDEAMEHLATYLTDGTKQSELEGLVEGTSSSEMEAKLKKIARLYREAEKITSQSTRNYKNDVSFSDRATKALFYELLKQESLSDSVLNQVTDSSKRNEFENLVDDSIERVRMLSDIDSVDTIYTEYQSVINEKATLIKKLNDLRANSSATDEEKQDLIFQINELDYRKGNNNALSISKSFAEINDPARFSIGRESFYDYATAKNYTNNKTALRELEDLGFDINDIKKNFTESPAKVEQYLNVLKKYLDNSVSILSNINSNNSPVEFILNDLKKYIDELAKDSSQIDDLRIRLENEKDELFGYEDPVTGDIEESILGGGVLNPINFPTLQSVKDYINTLPLSPDDKKYALDTAELYFELKDELDSTQKIQDAADMFNVGKDLSWQNLNRNTDSNILATATLLQSEKLKFSTNNRSITAKREYVQKFIDLANQLLSDYNRNKGTFSNYGNTIQRLKDIETIIRIYKDRPEDLNTTEFEGLMDSLENLIPKLEEAAVTAKENDESRLKEQKEFETFHDEKMWNQIGLSFFDNDGKPSSTVSVVNSAIWNKVVELVPEAEQIKNDAPNHPNKPFNRAFVEKILQKIKTLPEAKVKELQDIIVSQVNKFSIGNTVVENVLTTLDAVSPSNGALKEDGLLFGLFDVSAIRNLVSSIKFAPNGIINIFIVKDKVNDHRLLNKLLGELLADPNKNIDLADGQVIKASDLAVVIEECLVQESLLALAESLDSKYNFVDYLQNQSTSSAGNSFALNGQQEVASHEVLKWYNSLKGFSFATLFGPAGTGKTSLVKWLMKALSLTNDNTVVVSFDPTSTETINTALGTTKKVDSSKVLLTSMSSITDSVNALIIDEIGVLGEADLNKLYENINTLNKARNARNVQSVKVLVLGDPTQLSESSNQLIPAFYKYPHMSVLGTKIIPFLSIPYRSDIQAINQVSDSFRANESEVKDLMVRATSTPGTQSQGVHVLPQVGGIEAQIKESSVDQKDRVIVTNNPAKYDALKNAGETVLLPSEVQGRTFKEVYVDIKKDPREQSISYNTKMYVAISRATDYVGYIDYSNTHQNVTDPNIQQEIIADRLKNLNEKSNAKNEYDVKLQIEANIMGGKIAPPGTPPGTNTGAGPTGSTTPTDIEDDSQPEDGDESDDEPVVTDDVEEDSDQPIDEDGISTNPSSEKPVTHPTNDGLANYGPNASNRGVKGDDVVIVRTQNIKGGQPMYRVYKNIAPNTYLELGVLSMDDLVSLGLTVDSYEEIPFTDSGNRVHVFELKANEYMNAVVGSANGLNYQYEGGGLSIANVIDKMKQVFADGTSFVARLFIPSNTDVSNNKFGLGGANPRIAGMPYLIVEHKSSTGGPARTQYVRFNPKPISKNSKIIQTVKNYYQLATRLQELTGFTPESEEFGNLISIFSDDLAINYVNNTPVIVSPVIGSSLSPNVVYRLPSSIAPENQVEVANIIYEIAKLVYGVEKRKGTVTSLADFFNILNRDGLYNGDPTTDPKNNIIVELKKLQKDPLFAGRIGSYNDNELSNLADSLLSSNDLRSGNILVNVFGFTLAELGGTTAKTTKTNPTRIAYREFRKAITKVGGLGQESYSLIVVDEEDTTDNNPYNNRNKILKNSAGNEEIYSTFFPTLGKGALARAMNVLSLSNKKINNEEFSYSFNYTSTKTGGKKTLTQKRAKPILNLNSTKASNERRDRAFYHALRTIFTETLTQSGFDTLTQKDVDGKFINELGKYVYKSGIDFKLSKRFDLALNENLSILIDFLVNEGYLTQDTINEIYSGTTNVMPFSVIEYLASDSNYNDQGFAIENNNGIFVRTGVQRSSTYTDSSKSTIASLGVNELGEAMTDPSSETGTKVMEFVKKEGFNTLEEYADSILTTSFSDLQKPSLTIIPGTTETAPEAPGESTTSVETNPFADDDLENLNLDEESTNCG
jgi:hypothetical protein